MKKSVFIFLCSFVLFSFVCAIPPTLIGEKEHVDSDDENYFREFVAIISGSYSYPDSCVDISQTIKYPISSRSLPFFGVLGFVSVVIIIVAFYLFF